MRAAAGVCSAASGIAAKLLFRDRRVDLLTLNAWQMLFGSIPLPVIVFLTSDIHSVWSWSQWYIVTLLCNVILVCGLSLFLWFYSLRRLQAGTPDSDVWRPRSSASSLLGSNWGATGPA